jgi:hypothetical protein
MCRLLAAAIAMLAVASTALAQDKPMASTLSPKEIASGRLMLFDGVSMYGWRIDGEATIKDGWLVLGGMKATTATSTALLCANQIWIETDYSADLPDAKLPRLTLSDLRVNVVPTRGGRVGYSFPERRRQLNQVRFNVPAGTTLKVRDVFVDPVPGQELFNGKTLGGWKVNAADPKRMASKFAVTKEGELSVKNGPGDLVTEKEFGNFVLQFDCKTLGKGLNSGIFFRSIPGQYQNGYEAQIQNLFKGDDRTKPVDYGTGAIYRRIPARRVVSNDNEWFTMTVAANGKHIATWVNGYQTVDWVDERPADDNPRKGFRAAKGTISIQGHDPTTDLLFRNIRIAEIPAGK